MPAPIVTDRFEATKSMSTDTGLEKAADRTPAIITTPDEYRGALLRWQAQHYNVLTPFTNISGMAAQFGILTSTVQIDVDKDAGEVYDNSGGLPFLKDGEVALAKRGLRKIAECAGISTKTDRTNTVQHPAIPYYWEMKATATYRGIDGAVVTREATMDWDLRDGSDRLKGFKPNQITEARKNGLRNCEARAVNAVIRECGCGLKQKYAKAELAKPFVVCRVMFQPDMSDPDQKRIVAENYFRGTAAMYPPAPHKVIDAEVAEPRQVGQGSTATDPSAPSTGTPDLNAPPTPDAVKIVHLESKPWEKSGRKGTRYLITDSLGVVYSTLDKQHYADAERFKAAGDWVEIITEKNGEFVNVLEIVRAGAQPSLLPDPGSL